MLECLQKKIYLIEIVRQTIYDYLVSATAPTFPSVYQIWIDSVHDVIMQWNGTEWVPQVYNISLLVDAAHQRYKLALTQTDPWSASNQWVHKNELQSFSGKIRAQLPIIEFDPFLELSTTSLMTYNWKYRPNTTSIYTDVSVQPTLFELQNITNVDPSNRAYIFVNANTILLHPSFGNVTGDIAIGSRIKVAGTAENNGYYYVQSVKYAQQTATSLYQTYITLTDNVPNPFDIPLGSSVSPEKTALGDPWLGYDQQWIYYGVKDVNATSIQPVKNPMLDIFVQAYQLDGYETNVGLMWQSFSFINDYNIGVNIRLDSSLHSFVLYDDYQEGDLRVYINGVRQYGNFQDARSDINPNYVGFIVFDDSVSLGMNDLVRIELGEYALSDLGRRAIYAKTNANLVDPTLANELVNITTYRRIEQSKDAKNIYPWFNVYDVDGNPETVASRIFTYREDQTYPVNSYILKRIVNDTSTNDYGFTQELSDPVTGELYSYKNFSQPNFPLQTIWKRGINNEQYVPQKLSDGSWELPNPWYYNINHELRTDINLSQCLTHFNTIILAQKVPGVLNSTNVNQIHLSDNINYGLGGTIKEHNNGMDLSISSVLVNNVNPLQLIQFAHDQYLNGYNFIQEEYIKNVVSSLINQTSYGSLAAFQTYLNNVLINAYESNEKFDEWFGDSTTYNPSTDIGIQNWIATLPFLGLAPKKVCYTLFDQNLNLNAVSCHDGHIQDINLQPSVIQLFFTTLIQSGAIQQSVTSDSTPFPPSVGAGSILVRTNTVAKTRNAYRLSASGTWELLNFQNMLANVVLAIEQKSI